MAPDTSAKPSGVPSADTLLEAGIRDVSSTLSTKISLTESLQMILETMFRCGLFSRVLFCMTDRRTNSMIGKFGFGDHIEELIKVFRFPLDYAPDVFHVSLQQQVDIIISDVTAEKIRHRIPDWYRQHVKGESFVLFPVGVDRQSVAMLYGDQLARGKLNRIEEKTLNLLKTLRNQAALAIKQKRGA